MACGTFLYQSCKTSTYTRCLQLFTTINSVLGFVETLSSNAMHSKLSKEHYVMDILVYVIDAFPFMKYKSGSANAFSIYEYLEVSACKSLQRLRDYNGSPRNWLSEFFANNLSFSDSFVQNFTFQILLLEAFVLDPEWWSVVTGQSFSLELEIPER